MILNSDLTADIIEEFFKISLAAITHSPWQPCFRDQFHFSYFCKGPPSEHPGQSVYNSDQ